MFYFDLMPHRIYNSFEIDKKQFYFCLLRLSTLCTYNTSVRLELRLKRLRMCVILSSENLCGNGYTVHDGHRTNGKITVEISTKRNPSKIVASIVECAESRQETGSEIATGRTRTRLLYTIYVYRFPSVIATDNRGELYE